MPKLHLIQLEFSYSAGRPSSNYCERNKKFKQTDDLENIYQNKLDKGFFAHDALYFESKNLAKRTISDYLRFSKIKLLKLL